jgi:branched-subunit amino acid aminotransferase/4-amino-4-deoxychorismate lyase
MFKVKLLWESFRHKFVSIDMVQVLESPPKKDLLQQYRNCPYTAFHTRSKRVPMLGLHLERLAIGCGALGIPYTDVRADLKKIIDEATGDLSLIVIMSNSGAIIAVDPFWPPALDPCDVYCFGSPRKNPTIKNTLWMEERQYVETRRPSGVTEMVLIENGKVYEGLVTNFFALMDGYLVTAPFDKVLPGTTAREVVLLCTTLGIPVVFDFPNLGHTGWKGAFLTNANRWIHPIKSIRDEQGMCLTFDKFDTIKMLQTKLHERLISTAEVL